MQSAFRLLHPYRILCWVLLAFLWLGGIFVFRTGKAASFEMLTAWRAGWADTLFKYLTHLGDGILVLLVAVVFALRRQWRSMWFIVAAYLLSGLFAQSGKQLLASPRPKAFFESLGKQVYEVPGVDIHLHQSFPSGHTTSAFALMVCLVLMSPPGWRSWLYFLLAVGVGYSRVYLSQHFPVDVWAGACIGSLSALIVCLLMRGRVAG